MKSVQGVPKDFSASEKKKAVQYIGKNQARFNRVVEEFFRGPYRYNQQVAGALYEVVRRHPSLLDPHLKRFLVQLDAPDNYPAMTRNILRLLQLVDIPASLQGRAVNTAMRIMEDPEELVAAKVFSMTLLTNVAISHPALAREVRVIVERQYPFGTPAYRARARKVLMALER